MLADFAFHDSGHNNVECGVDRCDGNFLSGSAAPVHLELGHQTCAVLSKFFPEFTVE